MYDQVLTRNGYPCFSEAEIQRRHAALRQIMEQNNIQVALIYGAGFFNTDMFYLSNWPGGTEGYLLFPLDQDPVLLVQLYNHLPLAERLSFLSDNRWAGTDAAESLAELIKERGLEKARIGIVGRLTFSLYQRLQTAIPGCELVDFSGPYGQMRTVRSEEELQFFRIAGELTDQAIDALEANLRPGLREYELAAIVEHPFLQSGGYTGIHFMATTSMSEPEAFIPHQYLSDRVIQHGDVLITEITGSFWTYGGQIHRTFSMGAPTLDWARLHEVAVAGYEAVESVLKDGATVEQVKDAAEVIHQEGYTILDDLLHGSGLHPPILRTRPTEHKSPVSRTFGVAGSYDGFVFRENMVFTIQPHVITPDKRIGLQFGETVRITSDGVERLHRYPRKMVVLE